MTVDPQTFRKGAYKMYGAFWRALPGPWIIKFLLTLIILAAIVYALFEYVFPWLEPYLPLNESTVEGT